MIRRISTVCLSIVAGVCVAWVLSAAVARAADQDHKSADLHEHEHMLLNQDQVNKFKTSLDDNGIKNVRDDIDHHGADIDTAHNTALRFEAEKELMQNPDIRAKVKELASESTLKNLHNDDAKKVDNMINDGKTRRRMLMEMAVRESCREHAMQNDEAKTASEKQ